MKYTLSIVLILSLLAIGIFIGTQVDGIWSQKKEVHEHSVILLEEVQDVMKLITVEGYFSEVYDYKEYKHFDWPMFTKKALIRVKAKVSIGYDLEAADIEIDEGDRVIRITSIPKPEILSIDHDLDYYDLQQGSFNSFTTEDYNTLNQRAKSFIEAQVEDSKLYTRAENQLTDVQQLIRHIVEGYGWEVEFESDIAAPLN